MTSPRQIKLKDTKSLCPVCLRVVPAEVVEEHGEVLIRKTCPEHGPFEDVYWSDAALYRRFESFAHKGLGPENPNTSSLKGCPLDCGLCTNHKSATVLANLDLTNRCNMHCPVCFANASVSGYVYEPSLDQVREMMRVLREQKPAPCRAIQFAGGEPTVREDLLQIIRLAREMGFGHIQLATNGIKLAENVDYCKQLVDAGLHTVYLQFDGTTPRPYVILRGYDALPQKLDAIENCRRANLTSVVLVPTLAKGVNDDQVGDMIRFAVKNSDVVRAVNVQPISFSGRISGVDLKDQRITIPDFMRLVEEQTHGQITRGDFFPVPSVVPVSELVQSLTHVPQSHFTCHPHCGSATYVFVDGERMIPITRFIDVEALLTLLEELAQRAEQGHGLDRQRVISEVTRRLPKLVRPREFLRSRDIVRLMLRLLREGTPEALAEFHHNAILIGCMHFMDPYNFDVGRVERCVIHYVVPDGRIIPFCSFNNLHRQEVEAKFSIPLRAWSDRNRAVT